jgi:ActR/RegA family two-component response regulator
MITRNILIVDDDAALLEILALTMSELGFQVTCANTCSEALTAVKSQNFQHALLDYHLDDGNGIELMALLRQTQPEIEVTLMSGNPHAVKDQPTNQAINIKPLSSHKLRQLYCDRADKYNATNGRSIN